ncbi:Alcohol dehydrogenase, class IV [Streptomyces sp. DvalAA-14]|uniref:hydroxyacid-oxoacid transhydrogenase n=1 Tax=unclassified Streptomyces TaxID=2593676 RepID=UPI00081BB5B0|nr:MULTISPECIES: hydroxyacid-oxoacid transhydrogenase [unclassified Streptomyces]MYS19385.1 iron-containing alcohol dehydrogenase [Streptomyces sp. SID4948]SCD43244.1 Alcohol dehydrogenase, class IV [Streptomyces sp. DvalAA-14]
MESTEQIITWQAPALKFGVGASEEIGFELVRAGLRSVLLVADPALSRLGSARRLAKLIEQEGIAVEIFDGVRIEPTDTGCAEAAAELAHLRVDGYVALGGGSTIDTAKMLNLLGSHPGREVRDYLNRPIGGGAAVPGPLKPLIAMPTTAGSGSECTAMVALGITGMGLKTGISDRALRPSLALVDPLHTLTVPPAVTASSGYDVLTHACESYTARPYDRRAPYASPGDRPLYIGANPISDVWAEQALVLVGRYLRRAVLNPRDLEARIGMSQAAGFAAMGFGNAGTHLPHACAYPVAGLVRDYRPPGYEVDRPLVPHGSAVVSTAAAGFTFTYPTDPQRHLRAAELLGADLSGVTAANGADVLPAALRAIVADTGGPQGIGSFGYGHRDLPALVEGAMQQQRLLVCCPRQAGPDDLRRILDASLAGAA